MIVEVHIPVRYILEILSITKMKPYGQVLHTLTNTVHDKLFTMRKTSTSDGLTVRSLTHVQHTWVQTSFYTPTIFNIYMYVYNVSNIYFSTKNPLKSMYNISVSSVKTLLKSIMFCFF